MQGLGRDVILLLIGAGIGLISSIGTLFVSNYVQNLGKVRIYAAFVAVPGTERKWGFYKDDGQISLWVPLWIELLNTSNSNKIVRDFNLFAYQKGKELGAMMQTNQIGETSIANNGGYSFVIPPRSIAKYECIFLLKKGSLNDTDFDEIKVGYYDNKDKHRLLHLKAIEKCWETGSLPTDDLWISL